MTYFNGKQWAENVHLVSESEFFSVRFVVRCSLVRWFVGGALALVNVFMLTSSSSSSLSSLLLLSSSS